MALLPRRTALIGVLALAFAGLEPMIAGPALGATGVGTPSQLAPNSAVAAQKDPVLSWSAVSGAGSYQVELSKSNDFSDLTDMVSLPDGGATTVASYAVPQTLVHGVYYWRVRAQSASSTGNWSSDAQLDRAWSDAPSTAASTPSANVTAPQTGIASYPWRFAWTPLPDASSYEIELSTSSSFPTGSGKVPDGVSTIECLTDATSWTPYSTYEAATPDINVDNCDLSTFDPGGDAVFWRVRGIDDSATALVETASQKDTLECFGTPSSEGSSEGSLSTADALGTPTSAGQECSGWSATHSVGSPTGTATGTLGAVTSVALDCPAGTSSDFACSGMPELSWQPVAGATAYTVTIADDANFSNDERVYQTEFLSLTPRDQLADYTAGQGYHVAVEACDANGCTTPAVTTFTKRTPHATTLAAAKVTHGVRLSWTDLAANYATTTGTQSVEAEDYKVEVTSAANPDFDNPIVTATVDAACDATVSNSCYVPPGAASAGTDQTIVTLTSSGSYIWRVMPVDLSGNVLPAATDSGPFTVDLSRPAFDIATKNGVSVGGPLTIKASQAVTGVSASTVHIVPQGASPSAAVAGKLTVGSAPNTWVFHPTKPFAIGETYVLNVASSVHDSSGNTATVTGNGVRTTTVAKDTSKGWHYSAGWTKHPASGARSGSYKSATVGHKATIKVAGASATLYACKGPTMGSVTVTVGGHSKTVSERQSFTRCGVAIWQGALSNGEQTLTVTVHKRTGNLDEVVV